MDEPEGFFPERRLLAYRRSLLLRAEPVAAAAAKQNGSAWWILLICFWPVYIPIGMSMHPRHAPGGHLPPILIFGSYLLVACLMTFAVLGVCIGTYRGLTAARAPRTNSTAHPPR